MPVLDCHTSHLRAISNKQLQNLDRWTGKELRADPKYIKNGESTLGLHIPTKSMFLETFMEHPLLAS